MFLAVLSIWHTVWIGVMHSERELPTHS